MKKIILLILGVQISFTCLAGISISPNFKESPNCEIFPTLAFTENGAVHSYISSNNQVNADKGLYHNLCTLAVEFAKPSTSRSKLTKQLLSRSELSSSFDTELFAKVELPALLANIKEATEKNITIESFKEIKFTNENNNSEYKVFNKIASFTLNLTKNNTIIRHKFEFFAEQCIKKDHYHISSISIEKLSPTKFAPWWHSPLKWTLIGCGGLAAGYFVYHKWFKK